MNSKTILLLLALFLPTLVLAQSFRPLVGINGVDPNADFNTYINTLYTLSISVAALLAVIKIIIAGVKWMLSDVVTTKQDAKGEMQGALIGLLVVISAVLVLNVINPQLTTSKLFIDKIPGLTAAGRSVTGGAGGEGVPPAVSTRVGGSAPQTAAGEAAIRRTSPPTDCRAATAGQTCQAEIAACEAANGRPVRPAFGQKVGCSFGNETTVACPGSDSGDGFGTVVFNCTADIADCNRNRGTWYTNSSGSGGTCVTPF